MVVAEFLKTVNPIAERIRHFEGMRQKWLLDEHNLELVQKDSVIGPRGITSKLVTVKLKETPEDSFLARFHEDSKADLYIQFDSTFNALNPIQRSIAWGIIGSYCKPNKYVHLEEEYLGDNIFNEGYSFFSELYQKHPGIYENALAVLENFNDRLRSAYSSESH